MTKSRRREASTVSDTVSDMVADTIANTCDYWLTTIIMGRYYSGDIEGKFWFGVQSSRDPEFFGGQAVEPGHVEYYFEKEDLPAIIEGLRKCEEALGEHRQTLDTYFEVTKGYTDEELATLLGQPDEKSANGLLEWYARLELGEKIKACVEEHGECAFDAEL